MTRTAPPILEHKAQGGRVVKLVNLDHIREEERRASLRSMNQWMKKPIEGSTYTALDIPVEIWAIIFSHFSDIEDFRTALLVCHLWCEALTDRRCWARATIPISNPAWIQQPGCDFSFLQPNDSLHAFGFRFCTEEQLERLKWHGITRICLQGPNILKEDIHIKQLTHELPETKEMTFFCMAPSAEAMKIIHIGCPAITTVRAVYWNHAALTRLSNLANIKTLYLENCIGVSQFEILNLCRSLPKLRHVYVLGCDGIDANTLVPVTKALPAIKFMYAPISALFSKWHFRNGDRKSVV